VLAQHSLGLELKKKKKHPGCMSTSSGPMEVQLYPEWALHFDPNFSLEHAGML